MGNRFGKYWEMMEGGHPEEPRYEVFKCTDCGATTRPDNGWNGEPNTHLCKPGCRCKETGLKVVKPTDLFRENYEVIFPHSIGAGL